MPLCKVADDVDLYFEDFGNGTPIVFTNSGNSTHAMWGSQIADLARMFRTITYDLRGTGNSSKPRTGYAVADIADDVCTLIDRLSIGPVVLVGHGIGAHFNIVAADTRPDLVKALVLVSSGPWFSGERDGIAGGLAKEFLTFLAEHYERGVPYATTCEEMIRDWLFYRPQSAAVLQSALEQALTWPQFVLGALSGGLRDIDHRDRFSRLLVPTLIMHGRYDRKQLYSGAVHAARLIRGARLVTFERSAHMAQIEEIRAFNEALVDFTSGVGGLGLGQVA